jgi:hypothetical protein
MENRRAAARKRHRFPKQVKPVHIYAFARVTGPFRAEPVNGTQWRFKRDAVIQVIGTSLPAATFAKAVQKESFRQTMHRIRYRSTARRRAWRTCRDLEAALHGKPDAAKNFL